MFAVIRVDSASVDVDKVTVTEVVSTEDEAIAEVERLNSIRRSDSYRYVWQATRWRRRSSAANGLPSSQ